MNPLDDSSQIQTLDKQNVYGSIKALPDQCLHAWKDVKKIDLPGNYQTATNIVMAGMGGSGLGARIIESAFNKNLKLPLTRVHDYHLPGWVNQSSLIICSSYSGNTEEIVSCAKQALERKSKLLSLTSGGKLLDLAKNSKTPFYLIKPDHNPSDQPRMAIGYSLIGQLGLLSLLGLIKLENNHLQSIAKTCQAILDKNHRQIPTSINPAKKLAEKLHRRQVIFVAANHLTGAGHTVKNQMNENAKHLSHRHDLPELNHHLMEGLQFPKSNPKALIFLFFNSSLYPTRIQQRLDLTSQVVEKNHISSLTWTASSKTKLTQIFELIQFGALVNFYLTILNGINPAPIKWVDYFKEKLNA